LLATTVFLIVSGTGHMSSPFIAAWMLVSVFGGLFGLYALLPLVLLAIGYGIYLYTLNVITVPSLTMYVLAFGLPIIISYVIWHQRGARENEKEKAVNALTEELNQVANKSDIVINAIADGVIAIDQKGIIQLMNPAAQSIIGWQKEDALSLDYHSILKIENDKGEPITEVNDPIQRCMKEARSVETDEMMLETKAGKKLFVSIIVSPVNEQGNGVIIVFRDITQQKFEEREQAEFVSTASHEMRTPVAAIEGYLGLALNPQTAQIDDKARTYLQKAHESAQHLGRLFQDLLDVTKADDGRLRSQPTVIDAIPYVRDIVTSFEPKAKDKGLTLVYKPDTTTAHSTHLSPQLYALADADHFREIVGNLVENAIKYTKNGDVTVDLTGDNDHVSVGVQDTGIGIPAEDIPHLFQKFYRVDNSDTREIGGTGLGLYLCRRLAETMNGRVYVKSEYGNGSTFFLEVPRVSADDATKFQASADNPNAPTFPLSTQGAAPAPKPVAAAAPAPDPIAPATPAPTTTVTPAAPATSTEVPAAETAPQAPTASTST
jgi:PAS domain S-box-containing protein